MKSASERPDDIVLPRRTQGKNGKGRPRFRDRPLFYAGNDLLSHTLSRAVQSALRGLTSVFGMGTGGTPAVISPTNLIAPLARSYLALKLSALHSPLRG